MDQAIISVLAGLPHELAAASQMRFSKEVYHRDATELSNAATECREVLAYLVV